MRRTSDRHRSCQGLRARAIDIAATAPNVEETDRSYRWVQLFFGIVCMARVANLQHGWTQFVNSLDAKFHWAARAAIQVAFAIFVITRLGLSPWKATSSTASGLVRL
jgi:hypothetical protein